MRHPVNAQVHTGTYRFVRVRHADRKADLWSGGLGPRGGNSARAWSWTRDGAEVFLFAVRGPCAGRSPLGVFLSEGGRCFLYSDLDFLAGA